MPAIILPSMTDKAITKPSKGDVFGVLWTTKNIDLDSKKGTFRLAPRLYEIFNNSDDDTDADIPVSFIRTNADGTDRWWAMTQANGISRTDGLLFKTVNTSPLTGFTQDAIASTPTDCVENMIIFGTESGTDKLVVARDTDLAKLANGTWTASWWDTTLAQSALSATHPHDIHQFLNLCLVPDGNVVHTIDDSDVVVTNRITIPDEYEIVWIDDDGYYAYFGTRHIRGGEGRIYWWDGTSETYNGYANAGGSQTFCGKPDINGIMHVVNDQGELRKIDGDDFVEVARFPFRESGKSWYNGFSATNIGERNRVMTHNSMDLIDGKLHMLISGALDDGEDEPLPNFPAGVWCYDPEAGLYPKMSLSLWAGSTDDETGTSTTVNPGAMKNINMPDFYQKAFFGSAIRYNNSTTRNAIMTMKDVSSIGLQKGYFVTSKVQGGSDFKSLWKRLHAAFRKMEASTDTIVVKYRTETTPTFSDQATDNIFLQGTWSDTNTFTINDADGSKLQVGDEIEVLHGKGAGSLAHITAITNTSANNYTIDIDETITGATSTCYIRVMRWKKLFAISSQTLQSKLGTIAKRSKWIQLKVELRGNTRSPELEELFIDFESSKR